METRGTIAAAAGIVITVQAGRFAWIESDIAGLADSVDRVEREAAFVRGQPSLALPALAAQPGSSSNS